MEEERQITTARAKGQIVILKTPRKELQIKPNTKLAVYKREDKIVVAKLTVPILDEELKSPSKEVGAQNKERKSQGKRKKKPTGTQTVE